MTWMSGSVLGCIAAVMIQLMADNAMKQYGIFFVAIIIGAINYHIIAC